MQDIQLELDDQQAQVTVTALVRISGGDVAFSLFSPDGGECEVFLKPEDAVRVADALIAVTSRVKEALTNVRPIRR
jgi:hypothetical protein